MTRFRHTKHPSVRVRFTTPGAVALGIALTVTAFAQTPGPQLPEGPGRDVTQKVCGSSCHGPDIIMGKGRTRDQWTAVVNAMVGRGAKASEAELAQIAQYLSSHFGPNMVVTAAPTRGR